MQFKRFKRLKRRDFLRAATAAIAGTPFLRKPLRADTPGFQRFPNVQNVSANGAAIVWTLPWPASGAVIVTDPAGNTQTLSGSPSAFYPAQTGLAAIYYQYIVSITRLNPDTLYSYQVIADGQILDPGPRALQFHTPGGGPFNFLHFADSGEGDDAQCQLRDQIVAEDAAMVVANGDLAYYLSTCDSIESNYYGIYRDMMAQVPFFASMGNHEYYTQAGANALAARVTPQVGVPSDDVGRYYSFDWGNVHFVALDTNLPLANAVAGKGPMLTWLDNDLRNTHKFWRVVFFHHPGYATGKHQDEQEAPWVRQYIVPILEKYGVQLVLNGHEHTYQRTYELLGGQTVAPNSGGIVYVTSGGGGADTYWTAPNDLIAQSIGMIHYLRTEVSGASITVRARGLGQTADIDSVILGPPPQIGSVVNGVASRAAIPSGGVISIFGRNLSPYDTVPSTPGPMLSAAGCSVTLNGAPVPLLYAGADQINALLPFVSVGPATLAVATPNGSVQTTVNIAPALSQ